jgi:hypothetical protein
VLTACATCFAVAGSTLVSTPKDAAIVSVSAVYGSKASAPVAPSSFELQARAILDAARGAARGTAMAEMAHVER